MYTNFCPFYSDIWPMKVEIDMGHMQHRCSSHVNNEFFWLQGEVGCRFRYSTKQPHTITVWRQATAVLLHKNDFWISLYTSSPPVHCTTEV